MKKEFVKYEIALELKELGFDEPCFGYYGVENELCVEISCNLDHNLTRRNFIAVPTCSQAFRWFRDTHNMLANVYSNASGFLFEYHDTIGGTHRYDSEFSGPNDGGCWDTYEETELECLKKLIEIVKEKK